MKNHLLEQFNATFDKKEWFVCLRDAVQGLTDEQARWKPEPGFNSVYEHVVHLVFWNDRYLHKLRGAQLPSVQTSEETFQAETKIHFDQLMVRADEVFSQWQAALAKGLPAGEKEDWVSITGHINLHNAYHVGQIVLMRKLQGSWKTEYGVS